MSASDFFQLVGVIVPVLGAVCATIWWYLTRYLKLHRKCRALTKQRDDLVEREAAQGKKAVLIKAEKGIRLREMKRIASSAAREGMTLHIAIMEKDTAS